MAKVLCSRLSSILPDIIHPSQSAFVAGRDIVGNILICQDLIKLLLGVLHRFHGFKFHPLCTKLSLNHLCFADDLLLLNRGDLTSISLMLRAFGTFSLASGLHMNSGKSNFYCNGVGDNIVQDIETITGMRRASIPFKYLGVKIMPKRLGVLDCQCLVDKVTERIQRLGAMKLCYAGRVVLISSVLSSLHSYWARIFMLPKMILKKIESVCRAFLWYGNENKERPYLVAWNQICQPKRKGGLGFKNLY
ncbi:uncharacterized protein LOC141649302 [Silene latifolia]|uniref:uncharacterized protein LOC141649302 n=1 Tax=Silene latifolia TaxID=37657 RepID=UPI003D77AEA3